MSLFLWADTHFGHANILDFTTRPYRNVEEMNEGLVAKWNSQVQEKDTIWLLGDFALRTQHFDIFDIFKRLNGVKNLIKGNHDYKNPVVLRLPWNEIADLKEVKFAGNRATLCHYPLETWPASWHGSMMLHGHCHGTLKRKLPKRFDVGVDVEPVPVRWEVLVARAAAEQFKPVDRHGERQEEVEAE